MAFDPSGNNIMGKIQVDVVFNKEKDFKLTIDKMRSMNLFCGKNGSGKSMVHKWMWLASFMLQMYKVALMTTPKAAEEQVQKLVEELLPMMFHKNDIIDGFCSIEDTNESIYRLDLGFTDSKITYFNIDMKDPEFFRHTEINLVQYNTKECRTFDQYEKFLSMKKMVGVQQFITPADFLKLVDFYRIYEILWFEKLIARSMDWIQNGIPQIYQDKLDKVKDTIELGDNPRFKFYDGIIGIESSKHNCRLSTLSAGEQSYLMLTVFAN